jgi:hypothetical protein
MILLQIPRKMIGMSRSIFSRSLPALLLPLALLSAGCSDNDNGTDNPTAPTPTTVTESVSGSVARNGAVTRPFVANTGSITATLTTVTPDTAVIGFALGEWNATTELCQLKLTNDAATQGKVLLGSAQVTANYCVRVYDATGQLAAPVSFEVTLLHF